MPADVKIPGDGTVSRTWVIAGGALVVGILGYAYLHRAQKVPGPDQGTEGDVVGAELPPADLASVSTGGGTTTTGLQFITTNAQWSADATEKMVALGYDSVAVSQALGKYLASQLLSKQEAQYVYTAIALSGSPPVGSFSVRLEPTPTTASTAAPARPGGLKVTWQANHKQYILSWNRVSGATGYGVYRNGSPYAFVNDTDKAIGNQTAAWTVKAHDAHNRYSLPSNPIPTVRRK